MFTLDPDLDFSTLPGSRIPDSGVKKAPDPGSGSATVVLGLPLRIVKCLSCKEGT
jgi:hypothetical protein